MQTKTVHHPIITAMQNRHFVLLDVAPFVGSILGAIVLWWVGLTAGAWVSFVVMWYVGVVGIELGYHRYFSHGAFETTRALRALLAVFGAMAGQGPVVTWASTHRHHHNHSDTPEDTHSPHHRGGILRGFIHAQLTWKWSYPYPNPSLYTPELVKDGTITLLSRYYYAWVVLGVVLPGAIAAAIDRSWHGLAAGMLFGGVIRLFLGNQVTFLVNSLCHVAGSRPFESKDQSRNVAPLIPLTLGGSLHNCHHAFPSTANNALLGWQIDPGYWVIRGAERLGLSWDVRTIPERVIQRRRVGAHPARIGGAPAANDSPCEVEAAE
jgi:stearoyl-CoA desaturase (delta-9 desaturase)